MNMNISQEDIRISVESITLFYMPYNRTAFLHECLTLIMLSFTYCTYNMYDLLYVMKGAADIMLHNHFELIEHDSKHV